MEPLDPAKNEENSGFSKRRISSILKAPRKSIIFPEPVEQENVVECAKPVEKRNSRRVSFAPANDVLLFSKEVKNASPARSPLLELITSTAAAKQNRVQVVVAEDGIQQITGMETLLNAPLHAQQKDTVNFVTGTDFGEKTVMFSTDDAFMDMTHSHTINLGIDADASLENDDILPTSGEKTVMFTADDGSMDMALSHTLNMSGLKSLPTRSVEKGNISPSVPCLDPGFKNFLASFSRPSGHSVDAVFTRMTPPAGTSSGFLAQISAKRPDVDKENRAPTSLSAVTEKSLNTSRKIGQSSYGSVLYPNDDVSMDNDDDDPFQCLFPTQEMYSDIESVSQTAEKTQQQQSRKTLESFNTKDLDKKSLKNPSLNASNQGHKVKLDTKDEHREKTIMDTEAQRGHIRGLIDSDDPFQFLFPTQYMYALSESLKSAEMTSGPHHSEAGGPSNRTGMETSLRPSLKTTVQRHQVKFDAEDDCKEKTVRFSAEAACMDATQSHTVNHLELQSHPNVDFLPPFGEKTVRFTARDAAMDVTQSHTVNIVGDLELQSQQKSDFSLTCGEKTVRFTARDAAMDVTQREDFLPTCGEKTVRFTAHDAAMDVTQSHTVNIVGDLELQSQQKEDFLPTCGEKTVRFTAHDAAMDVTQREDFLPTCGEKTVRFTANDAAMDVTQSHTVNIGANLEPQFYQNVDFLPPCGEKTVRFTAKDAAMDMSQCLTVNIANNSVSDSVLQYQDSNILSILSVKERESETCRQRRNRSSSAHTLDPGLKHSLSKMSPWANPVITKAVVPPASSPQETGHTNGFLDKLKPQKPDVKTENEVPGLISAVMEKSVNKTVTDRPADNVSMDMSEAQTDHILGQTCKDEPPQSLSSTQDLHPRSDHLKKAEATSQQSNGSSNLDGVEMTNHPDSLDSNETDTMKEPKPRNQACSPSAVDHGVDTVPSRKGRRMSLADLHSKVRRLSHMINTTPDTIALNSCTAPLPHLERHMDKISKDKPNSLPVMEPEPEIGLVNTEENTQAQCLMQEEQPSTTPFNLKTKQLMSRLSVGGFKPKLPQRNKPDDPKKVNSVGEHTRTINVSVTSQLSNLDNDVSDIYDEELGSCEDMSEMLDPRSPQKATERVGPYQELKMDEDDVFEQDFISVVHVNKRSRPADENGLVNEKRLKTSTEMADDFKMSHVEDCDGNTAAAPSMTTQTSDSSSHTANIRCEATFESTLRQSMFESQLEDYASDIQRKFEDGTITALEFFKLFNIDFVIHNPRQSILPGRLLSDTDCTMMDLLKDRHINRPKQMVYETNVLNLTEAVEGLKERMRDLDKPLKIVNRPLWEEMRHFSEKELKSFGAKLKERNNLFRKMSKVQSHEKKEVLYADLVQANLEEQQRLRGTIKEADEMIQSLDDCICELETEFLAVEEKGFEDTPSLKSLQKEMQKVTEVLADNDRQISELEMQNKQNSNKLSRLKADMMNLESHVAVLHRLNEWKLGEKKDNCSVYSFLNKTFDVQLVYEKFNGNEADNESERKISHITFKRQLDDEKSQCHASLVHRLLSQYIEGETSWVEKYPTSRHVPKLLLDVGLVVSCCRLLGEEMRLLKMWGGLRLDILNISCVDNQVHVVFCSLKKISKFEVIFSVSVTNHLYVLQVQSFKNRIGSTTIQQIEEIVASFNPAKNLLTKIIKKIHENLLC